MKDSLANAELAVMNLIWDHDQSLTAREIREQLYPDATRAQHGTVQRLLQRLEDKSFVVRDSSHAVHFFTANVTREAYAGGQLETLAEKLTAGSVAPLLTHLVEQNKISQDEINSIRKLLDEHDSEASRNVRRKRRGGRS